MLTNIMEKRKKCLDLNESFRILIYVSEHLCKENKDK